MGILTADMRRVVEEQGLGYDATVCPDGTPNHSPKGTTAVWDDDHLAFADLHSPGTVANPRQNPAIELNVVDRFARTGYRFKGVGAVLDARPMFEAAVAFYRRRGVAGAIRHVVLVEVRSAAPLVSPVYDAGATEEEVRGRWARHYLEILGLPDEGAPRQAARRFIGWRGHPPAGREATRAPPGPRERPAGGRDAGAG